MSSQKSKSSVIERDIYVYQQQTGEFRNHHRDQIAVCWIVGPYFRIGLGLFFWSRGLLRKVQENI